VKEVEAAGPPPLATYTYDLNGNRSSKTLENGTVSSYSYDNARRLTQVKHTLGSSTLAQIDYTLNSVGNRTSKNATGTIPNRNEAYGYDAIDQVISSDYGSRTETFAYDATGNRQSVNDTAAYTANALNQYTNVGGDLVLYDSNGNLTSKGLTSSFSYDSKNRLLVAAQGSNTMSVAYDYRNRPVSRTINGKVTHYIYDNWNLIAEYDTSGALQTKYVHGAMVDELLVKIDATGTVYYHHDGLGSTVALSDGSGNLVESYQYDVFGRVTIYDASNSVISVSSVVNRFLFTGREWIQEVGLYDYRNRVYSAELGRFLQTDPIRFGAGDVNLYRYVGNNSVMWTDPTGLHLTLAVWYYCRARARLVQDTQSICRCNVGFVEGTGASEEIYLAESIARGIAEAASLVPPAGCKAVGTVRVQCIRRRAIINEGLPTV
jgi:RHS repeat-associated protein